MKKLKFCLIFVFILISMVLLLTISASAATYSGECGATDADNVTWTLDTTTGALTISGEGRMSNFSFHDAPAWRPDASFIKSITIGEGVGIPNLHPLKNNGVF